MSLMRVPFFAALFVGAIAAMSPVQAGGFSMSTGAAVFGGANSGTKVKARNKYFKYSSRTYANTSVEVLYGGKIAIGNAHAGSDTKYNAYGKSKYKSWNHAKAKVYAKGGKIMAKARSATYTKIKVAGKAYVVSKEVARAMVRHTPLGTQAAADSHTHVSAASNGYIGVHTGTNNHATVRVRH